MTIKKPTIPTRAPAAAGGTSTVTDQQIQALGLPGPVFWGYKEGYKTSHAYQGSTYSTIKVPAWVKDTDDGTRGITYYNQNQAKLWRKMVKLGLPAGESAISPNAQQWWALALQYSADALKKGKEITPMEALSKLAQDYAKTGGAAYGGGQQPFTGTKNQTSTQTNVSLDLSSAKTARAIIDRTLADELGRAATKEERADFLRALNGYERKHPAKSVSTTQTSSQYQAGDLVDQNSSTSTKTSGGVTDTDRLEMAKERAQANPEWAEYQVGTTYFDALLQAIQAPGDQG